MKYSTNFDIKNEDSKENIFVILYDRVYTSGSSSSFYLHTLTLEAASQATFNIPAAPWSGFLCQPDFFQTYAEQDLRRSQSWLYGPQVDLSGKDLGFEYTPVFLEEKYYNSNGGRGTYDGARCWKWHYQTDGSLKEYTVSMDNDFAIFRYADVVLMYVEALVRQNRTSEAIQLADFKKIRTRAGLDAYITSQLTIDELYAERGRELAWEGWRHEDMIRFGKYLKKYWAHPDQSSETFRNVFPIPTDILNANPKLSQNKDY
ncbi:RagB/SusD family nutrient uptake outer membrane protein [Bacteroides ovatus]|uniref:RagB/SusD family nutrient uptake outer membrane protein n=1 Tax=Bacteroides ovatus TaxID=28116 RepID=UPI001E362D9F|nr:RagB/SusD family nutrient uptake outer membrane protein [Bacteroides ovatus]MDC2657242.1 RagB/SusD family nutrient uptake outer membrane protein [Bacteroides ovatus]